MTDASTNALEFMKRLMPIEEVTPMRMHAQSSARLPANAHVHLPPNFSAFTSVEQAVNLAAEQGVAVLGVSNYYDYDVYGDFSTLARERGIFPLYGLEIICLLADLQKNGVKLNDPGNPGKLYICGKGITKFAHMTPRASQILGMIRQNDSTRMARLIEQLARVFAERGLPTHQTEETVITRMMNRYECPRSRIYLQERHVCLAFQERVFDVVPPYDRIADLTKVFGVAPKAGPEDAVGMQNEIRSHLLKSGKPGYVPETFIGFDDAFELIHELGGIPCYPTLADGVKPICQFEENIDKLIASIKAWNIGCCEFIPLRNTPGVLSKYVKAMRGAGMLVTAGTEHNTLELLPIAPTCAGGDAIPSDIQDIFWEGACVVAAHQFFTLNDQTGFVAQCGEARIKELARIGAMIIDKYRNQ